MESDVVARWVRGGLRLDHAGNRPINIRITAGSWQACALKLEIR